MMILISINAQSKFIAHVIIAGLLFGTGGCQKVADANRSDAIRRLDSVVRLLENVQWANRVPSHSLVDQSDTLIEFPEMLVSDERLKINNDVYEDSSAWYMDGPEAYNFIIRDVKFLEGPVLLDGTDTTTVVDVDFQYPLNNTVSPLQYWEGDSVVLMSSFIFNKPVQFRSGFSTSRLRVFECDFKDELLVQPLHSNPLFSDCIFDKGVRLKMWYNLNDEADDPVYREKNKNRIYKNLIFKNCILKGSLDLDSCSFDSSSTLVLENTYLPDTLDLTSAEVGQKINLLNANQNFDGKKCELILTGFDLEKIDLQYSNFHLCFPAKVANDVRKRDYISSVYQLLLKKFEQTGFNESHRLLDIEYNEWKSKSDRTLVVSDYWWKFGYEKWRIIIYSLLFCLIFSCINYFLYIRLQVVYPVEDLQWIKISYTSNKTLLVMKRAFSVVLYTGLLFFKVSIDYKNLSFKRIYLASLIIFEYIVGLICTGFLANWILKG